MNEHSNRIFDQNGFSIFPNSIIFEEKKIMADNFFEGSTAAVGTIFTVIALGILTAILIWG